MGTPGGGPAGDFRKAGRQPAFRAPDRAGMQPEQDGFLIALPERLAEGGGLLRAEASLGPVLTRGFRQQMGFSSRSRSISCSSEAAGYAPVASRRRDGAPDITHAQRISRLAAARNGGLDARRSRCHALPAGDRPLLRGADERLFRH
ncbi:MAG: hypothetical protein ACLSHC_13525 [Bilophila wadsworthia]